MRRLLLVLALCSALSLGVVAQSADGTVDVPPAPCGTVDVPPCPTAPAEGAVDVPPSPDPTAAALLTLFDLLGVI